MKEFYYFGTSLTEYGHFLFYVSGDHMYKVYTSIDTFPFHPEYLTNRLDKGEVIFYQGGGYTVIGISGSPKDTRPGTKSIFFINEILNKQEMINIVMLHPVASKLIGAMSFKIKWTK